jgi:predicted alpha-1,2-mannosidase
MIPFLVAAVLAASLSPASLIDPFVGTSGTAVGGPIDTFPGADMPFGMVQWSPDTPSQNAGGGYEYSDSSITGFSLTHLSGPGCSVFGDFAMMPLNASPTDLSKIATPFSHANEIAAPGYYEVSLGTPTIRVQLAVTDRTGLGVFTFSGPTGAISINPASNQAGVTDARITKIDDRTIAARATSGYFCGMPDQYTVYEVLRFDRPVASLQIPAPVHGSHPFAVASFDTSRDPIVRVQVALSFVDERGAQRNLAAEATSWNIVDVRNRALSAWNQMLSRLSVSGGTHDRQRQFYTALYHAMLHPNSIDDVDGRYRGYDGRIHHVRSGHHEYANYSDWDIYRTQAPLIALLAPAESSDMMQSLVDAYQSSGWLPRWALVNQPTSVMGGDSVDAVIAGAYAFGAHDFDVRAALRGMVKGATDTTDPPGYGWYLERPESADYQRLGYIPNTHTTSVSPVPNGASETLEYALDDASIAAFARAIGDERTYRRFLPRASNWATLMDTAAASIEPRDERGAFEVDPVTESGQNGFQEGNAAQYTWMVPQDLAGLVRGLGGPRSAAAKLDLLFSQINAGQDHPFAWMGNEPSIGAPWAYLAVGEPWREQDIVDTVMDTLYTDRPDGIPGNDDLGTMSAWYVWSSIGLYPQFTAVRSLDIGAPRFPHVEIRQPGGVHVIIDAAAASNKARYVQSVRVDERSLSRSWVALPQSGAMHLWFTLGDQPNASWASDPSDAMPAFAPAPPHFPASTNATVSTDTSEVDMQPGASRDIHVSVKGDAASIAVATQSGLNARYDSMAQTIALQAVQPGLYALDVSARDESTGARLPDAVIHVRVSAAGATLPLAWIANRFSNTVMPYDARTNALGVAVNVGEEPRDGVLTPNNRRYFVALRGAQAVAVIDTAARRAIATIRVGNSPNGTAISPDGHTVWVANYDDGTIQAIDAQTLVAGVPIQVGMGPRYIAVSPDGRHVFVTDQAQNTVSDVDARTMTLSRTIPTGARPTGLTISPDGTRLYVANNGTQDVDVIDVPSGRILTSVAAGVEAQMVGMTRDGRFAYVPNFSSDTVTPIDLVHLRALPDIVIGGQPFDVQWLRDDSAALVTLRRDNALVRIDREGRVGTPLFLGSGGSYTIALPH